MSEVVRLSTPTRDTSRDTCFEIDTLKGYVRVGGEPRDES